MGSSLCVLRMKVLKCLDLKYRLGHQYPTLFFSICDVVPVVTQVQPGTSNEIAASCHE